MRQLEIDTRGLTPVELAKAAHGEFLLSLTGNQSFWQPIEASRQFLVQMLESKGNVYGVTTGYGDSVTVSVEEELISQLPYNLSRFHGCGLGTYFDPIQSRAIVIARVLSLAKGYSAVRSEVLHMLVDLLGHNVVPRIPSEGSVGASGDLTPLSYVAAMLVGEREVWHNGSVRQASEVLAELNIQPIELGPKETLAIMNGTSVMTALNALALHDLSYMVSLGARITAMASLALLGNPAHFDKALFDAKPYPGQSAVAALVHSDVARFQQRHAPVRLQDRYSIRCAPHILGVCADSLVWMEQWTNLELNSSNDNPIVDPHNQQVHHGGHFYGGHMAMVADSLKNSVANLADLFDRQMALLVDDKFNNGLPPNVSASSNGRAAINHGFKAVQIGASAWAAEALKLTMPASVFSRSTECHNQDKVSMGTIAARDALRVAELTRQVMAAQLLTATQAIELRMRSGELEPDDLSDGVRQIMAQVRDISSTLDEDRPLEHELRAIVASMARHEFVANPLEL